MADLTPEQKQALKAIEGSLHRMAMKIVEAPTSEREAIYESMRQSLKETKQTIPVDDGFLEQYMSWLRALVSIIERGGRAKGGRA
jgi:hypothetical protein